MSKSENMNRLLVTIAFVEMTCAAQIVCAQAETPSGQTEQLQKAEKKATEPRLERREKQNYVAIRTTVTMQGMATVMQKLMPEVGSWLRAHNVKASEPPFIRFLYIDMAKGLDI